MSAAEVRAFIGLGSNLHDPKTQVREALDQLGTLPLTRLVRCSSLYRTPPMGPQDQPDYINAVAEIVTTLSAGELLARLQEIEQLHGRIRGEQRWGPRTLDLDLLLYGQEIIDTPALQVPHPGISRRNFVLLPLYEIAPRVVIPGHGPLVDLVEAVSAAGMDKLDG